MRLRGAIFVFSLSLSSISVASPAALTAWDKTRVWLKVTSPGAQKYRCTYEIQVSFSDGSTALEVGSSEPLGGSAAGPIAEKTYAKMISNASIAKWECAAV